MKLSVQELCFVLRGNFCNKDREILLTGVSIDSRDKNLKACVFFALKGARHDGHDFLEEAIKAGAKALVVCKGTGFKNPKVKVIEVEDTLKSLQQLASYWRKKNKFSVIAITGSTGKTTTKQFCFILLKSEQEFEVVGSPFSYNNQYGVPLSLLSTEKDTRILIQEIGMSKKDEIKSLVKLVRPNIVTVTQVGDSHIGLLGGREEIAREKEDIYRLSPDAVHVFNWDDSYTRKMYERVISQKVLRFSKEYQLADVYLKLKEVKKLSLSIEGHIRGVKGEVSVPIVGEAHLNNLRAACTLALAAGLKPEEIWSRLPLCRQPAGRNQWLTLPSGAEVIFDAYNASPESVKALLDYFLSPLVERKKILIMGDFEELGSHLESFQKQWAQKLVQSPPDLLWILGSQAQDFARILKKVSYSEELHTSPQFTRDLAQKILPELNSSVSLAFKASRKMQMEKLLKYFQTS